MPDVQEVFRMSTQKIRQDPGAMDRQVSRQRKAARNKKIGALAVAAAIGLVAVTAVLVTRPGRDAEVPLGSRTPAPQSDPAPYFLDLSTNERTPLPEAMVADDLCGYTPSPDGTLITYSTPCGAVPTGSALDMTMIANIDGTEPHALQPPDGLNAYVAGWVDDDTILYWARRGGSGDLGNLYVHDLGGGEDTQITDLELTSAWWYELHIDVSPDGQTVLFDLPRSSDLTTKWDIWSVPVTGGEPTLDVRNAAFPMYVSDGEETAYVVPTPSNFIGDSIAIAGADGSRRTLVQSRDMGYAPTVSPDGTRIAFPIDGRFMYVVDVSTGEASMVAGMGIPAWLDDDTLIVTP